MTKNKLQKSKRMIERYREINKFKYSIFKITNPSIPTEVSSNPILAMIILEKLRELIEEIQGDIDSVSIDSIDIEDIIKNKNSEISELLVSEICLFDLESIKNQYENCLKAEKLNSIFPLADRKNKVKELKREINNLQLTIESLEKIEPRLALTQKEKVKNLQKEKEALEETFNFHSIEEIEVNLFIRLQNYLISISNDFDNKINFIERNCNYE